jgi:hypothetical protein
MNWAIPCAPTGDVAFGLNPDSMLICAATRLAGRPVRAAAVLTHPRYAGGIAVAINHPLVRWWPPPKLPILIAMKRIWRIVEIAAGLGFFICLVAISLSALIDPYRFGYDVPGGVGLLVCAFVGGLANHKRGGMSGISYY